MAITYNVYRDGVKIAEDVVENTYTDTELTPNTTYEYQVSAVNEHGLESVLSSTVSVTTDYSPISEFSLNVTELTLNVGQQETLTATILPETADQSVTWSSSNTDIATVDQSGNVVAVAVGQSTITATSSSNPEQSASCSVEVSAEEPNTPEGLNSPSHTDTTIDLEWNQ